MGKDIKEKYERICALKDRALALLEMGMNQDVSVIDAKEIGELMDIVKDATEAIKYSEEACYYHKVVEAMDESDPEEKSRQLNKYIPEYEGKFYTPIDYARRRDSRGRYMYTEPMWHDDMMDESYRDRMYYSSMSNGNSGGSSSTGSRSNSSNMTNMARDYREGRSPMVRRTYMEMKENGEDKTKSNKELERYISELGEDVTEMIENMDATEKALLKQKMSQLVTKIQ